jgi:hypothetical protein
MSISLDDAVDLTRTGDLWIFRGRSMPDRAIQLTTNSPVNHVGMAVVLEDLPPLMWHAELGRSLPDLWTGKHHRGVQLHDLRDSACLWANRYGQRGWLRQLEPPASAAMEDAVLRTVARLDGTPFPSSAQLAARWLRGRIPDIRLPNVRLGRSVRQEPMPDSVLETAYCAEVVALTYEAMGLLPGGRRPSWYDPGRFWSGDDLRLTGGAALGREIEVHIASK